MKSYFQIHKLLDNLNVLTDMIVADHEKSYTASYKEHMLRVQCELIDLKRKTSDYYQKLKRDERIIFLETTIHWLRTEAEKLTDHVEELKEENKKLRTKLEDTEKENAFIKSYSRQAKRHNMVL